MKRLRCLTVVVLIGLGVWLLTARPVWAGFDTNLNTQRQQVDKVLVFSKKLEKELGKRGAHVALVSRIGIPEEDLPEGVRYTHVGFAVYSKITTKDGQESLGYAMYNLYQSEEDPAVSHIVMDYPPDFFLAAHKLRAGVIIPSAELQRRLLALISDSEALRSFHNPHYSVISNPSDPGHQNCTEFVLRILVAAIYNTRNPRQIEANIRSYFIPKKIEVGNIRLWLGSILTPDVFLDDHQGTPRTATYGTIADFLKKYHLVREVFTVE